MDINYNLKLVTDAIIEKVETFEFNLISLPELNGFDTDIRIDPNFKEIFNELNKKRNHCLYWFETETITECFNLNVLLDKNRVMLSNSERVVPVINGNTNSNVLYVGVRRGGVRQYDKMTNISGRIIQHLGYYKKGSTQGLQLIHWAPKIDLTMKLKVVEFEKLPNEYLNVIEKLIAFQLKPQCGKH